MEQIRLSPRLAAIAAIVPAGAHLADVGTDHALLPISLLLSGAIASAVAADIRPGPLKRAEMNARRYGAKGIRFALCDGLDGISQEEADTVVIAGMGGENIAGILARAPWTHRDVTLLLQPMSRPEELRGFLYASGIEIASEQLVFDCGRIYSVICARGGSPAPYTAAELYTGRYEHIFNEELFLPFLSAWENKLDTALDGLARSGREEDVLRLAKLRTVRNEIGEMRSRYAEGT